MCGGYFVFQVYKHTHASLLTCELVTVTSVVLLPCRCIGTYRVNNLVCKNQIYYNIIHNIQTHVRIHAHGGRAIPFNLSEITCILLGRHLTCTWHNPQRILGTANPTDMAILRYVKENLEQQNHCCPSKWNMLYIAYACSRQGPRSDPNATVGALFNKAKESVPSALSNRTLTFQLLKRIKDYTLKETRRFLRAGQMEANSSKDSQYKECFLPPSGYSSPCKLAC